MRWLPAGVLCAASLAVMAQAAARPPADAWVTNAAYPGAALGVAGTEREFPLQAEVLAEVLKVSFRGASGAPEVHLWASVDEPGHWPARDWRVLAMQSRGEVWQAVVPVDVLDVPIAYFVLVPGRTNQLSPIRMCHPRALGLETPTHVFWPFLEGFEEGLSSWRSLTSGTTPGLSTNARHGRAALTLSLPPEHGSVTVGTTRVRGWHWVERGASGLAFWARTSDGSGQVRVSLHADAFTTNEVRAVATNLTALTPSWQRVELPFAQFPKFPVAALDWVSFEWTGGGAQTFLMDDLHLLGRWPAH